MVFSVWYAYIASLYPTMLKKLYSFVISITTLNFWMLDDLTVWFVPAIIVLYLLALLLHRLRIDGRLALLTFSVIAIIGICCSWGSIMILIERIPIFIAGYIMAGYLSTETMDRDRKWSAALIAVMLCLCYFGVLSINIRKISYIFYFFIAIGICYLISISKFPDCISNVLKKVGAVSFEIYLLFECIIKAVEMLVGSMKTQPLRAALLYNMASFIVALIIAVPLKLFGEKIGKQLKALLS